MSEPRQFTAEELDAARAQLAAQGETVPVAGPAAAPAEVGMSLLASGAEPANPDPGQLLKTIQALQARVAAMETAQAASHEPQVVTYAKAIAAHLDGKAAANPQYAASEHLSFGPGQELAGQLVDAASGQGDFHGTLGKLRRWLDKHSRRNPAVDYSYIRELADEAEEAREAAGSDAAGSQAA